MEAAARARVLKHGWITRTAKAGSSSDSRWTLTEVGTQVAGALSDGPKPLSAPAEPGTQELSPETPPKLCGPQILLVAATLENGA